MDREPLWFCLIGKNAHWEEATIFLYGYQSLLVKIEMIFPLITYMFIPNLIFYLNYEVSNSLDQRLILLVMCDYC